MNSLPSFKRPPVTEVVIAARFKSAGGYSLPALGDLTRHLQDGGFGTVEERPGYEAPAERFGHAAERSGGLTLELLSGSPPIRYWFLNVVGDELLQVQPNWFAANWRKVAPTAEYGRWDTRWQAFERWLAVTADAFATDELEFDQVEVTYINHIEPEGVWTDHGDAPKVFTSLARAEGAFLAAPEQYSTDLQYVMASPAHGEQLGRLHVTITPGFRRPAGAPIFVLNLTARGAPIGPGLLGVQTFADLAHEWIVRGFADLTTDAMHKAWKREA